MKGMDRVSRGAGFGGAVRYIFANFKASFLCASNALAARDERRAISKMGALAHRLRPDIKKPVWHQALRLPRGEVISHGQYREVADEYMRRMGWDSDRYQYIVIVSDDPEGQHIHIVANRVGINGSVYLGKNENLISTRVCQELERDYGLTLTKGPEYVVDERGIPRAVYAGPKDRKSKKGELRLAERLAREGSAKPLPRRTIQRILRGALAAGEAGGMAAFLSAAETGGIRVLANVAGTGRVNGLSFESGGIAFKASEVGDAYAWASLATSVGYDKARDQALLEARSLRHVSRDQLPPLGQPAQTTRLPAPPAAAVPIVTTAPKEEAYVPGYESNYRRARGASAASIGRRALTSGTAIDRLRSLPGRAVDVAGDAWLLDSSVEGLVQRDPQLLVGERRRPHSGLRHPAGAGAGPARAAASRGLRRDPRMLEEARLGQYIATLPDAPDVRGQGVAVTMVVILARALDDYEPKRGRFGTLYIRQSDNMYALLDRGDRVTVAHVDTDTVRAALALAASKWEKLELTGDIEFRRAAVRQAVRMGLGDRLADLSPELEMVRREEAARMTTERARPAAAAPVPARTPESGLATPPRPLPPAPRHRNRPM